MRSKRLWYGLVYSSLHVTHVLVSSSGIFSELSLCSSASIIVAHWSVERKSWACSGRWAHQDVFLLLVVACPAFVFLIGKISCILIQIGLEIPARLDTLNRENRITALLSRGSTSHQTNGQLTVPQNLFYPSLPIVLSNISFSKNSNMDVFTGLFRHLINGPLCGRCLNGLRTVSFNGLWIKSFTLT